MVVRFESMPDGIQISTRLRTSEEWRQILNTFEDASVYQTSAYGEATWNRRELSHFTVEQDAQIVAAAQVRVVKVPLINRGVAYVRWGPVFRRSGQPVDPSRFHVALAALHREYTQKRRLILRVIPNVY